jgi:hypothetical protein
MNTSFLNTSFINDNSVVYFENVEDEINEDTFLFRLIPSLQLDEEYE